jgi:hypothetical protein
MTDEPFVVNEEDVVFFAREPIEMVGVIERETLLRTPSVENVGIFSLLKSELVVSGVTVSEGTGRCDVLSYGPVNIYNNSPELQGNSLAFAKKIPYSGDEFFTIRNMKKYVIFLEIPGKFCLTYMELQQPDQEGNMVSSPYLERGPWSRSLEIGTSFGELLKILREWSLMLKPPFSLTEHPMAIWSKMFFDELNPSNEILAEIDSYPDMHLVKYLKGEENHRELDGSFPEMSDVMKDWVVSIVQNNPKQDSIEMINNL